MHGRFLVADADAAHPEGIAILAAAVSAWETRWDIFVPRPEARLFEPDGTVYAVAFAATHSIAYNHREHIIASGDLIVVPRGVALDIEPEIRMLGVRYDGAPPDHFRERFIQVWGFEHMSGPATAPGESAADVLPSTDLRHRLAYAHWEIPAVAAVELKTGFGVHLLIGLAGRTSIMLATDEARIDLPAGAVAVLGPDLSYRLEGIGRLGRLALMTDLEQEFRRNTAATDSGAAESPEYSHHHPNKTENSVFSEKWKSAGVGGGEEKEKS